MISLGWVHCHSGDGSNMWMSVLDPPASPHICSGSPATTPALAMVMMMIMMMIMIMMMMMMMIMYLCITRPGFWMWFRLIKAALGAGMGVLAALVFTIGYGKFKQKESETSHKVSPSW